MGTTDFTEPEMFRMHDPEAEVKRLRRGAGCMAVVAAVLVWVLLAMLLGVAGIKPPFNGIIAAVLGVGVAVLMWWLKAVQVRGWSDRIWLRVDPEGLVVRETHHVHAMRWNQLERIGAVSAKAKGPGVVLGTAAGPAGTAAVEGLGAAASALTRRTGIIARAHLTSESSALGSDRFNGPEVQIEVDVPKFAGPDWATGRFGQWLHRYRPDLHAVAVADRRGSKEQN